MLIIKNRRFFSPQTHSEIPLEFGNVDQINCLRKIQENAKKYEEGYEIDVSEDTDEEEVTEISFDWQCICSSTCYFSTTEDGYYDLKELLTEQKNLNCDNCEKNYHIIYNTETNLFLLKLSN